jgi:hypothetical protein
MANKSSADTARRVTRAARQQAIEGAWHGGRAPFGYRCEAGTLVVEPGNAELVREAAQRVLAGESLYRVLTDWNARGVPTGWGGEWSDKTLKTVLRNPSIKGVRSYRPLSPDGTRAKTSQMYTKAAWPAILDEDTWQQVNDALDARKQARSFYEGGSKRLFPFSGLIRCSNCGTAMVHRGGVYQCHRSGPGKCFRAIRAAEVAALVEEAVLAVFARITLDPSRRADGTKDATARAGLAAVLDADRARLARLDDDHYDGLIDRASWVRQRARIAERVEKARRDYQAAMPQTAPMIDVTTVAAEWEGRTPLWQFQAASLVLEAVLIHAHPADMMTAVPKRRDETTEAFHVRRDQHRAKVLAQRVEFVWRA